MNFCKNIFNVVDKIILNIILATKEPNKKKNANLQKNKQNQKVKHRRYNTLIEHNSFDEFYQGLYQNSWQDYGYQNDLGNHFISLDDAWYANYNN